MLPYKIQIVKPVATPSAQATKKEPKRMKDVTPLSLGTLSFEQDNTGLELPANDEV